MSQSAVSHILENYNTLTKSEKRLADYICQHTTDVEYMNIGTLAEICNVAEATISRFCKKLQYGGYHELKLALAKEAIFSSNQYYNPEPLDSTIDPHSFEARTQQLFNHNISSIQKTFTLLNETSIQKAVTLLTNAIHVYCIGQGGSSVMAMEAWARFSVITSQFIWIPDSHLQAMTASLSTKNDVIFLFSYSGSTRDCIGLLEIARERGASVILITHSPHSPAAAYADIVLLCGTREGPLQTGSIAAKLDQLFLIDILYNEYCLCNPQSTCSNREATSQAIAKKLI